MSRDWLESVWMQDAEIDLQGVEKAKEAMKQKQQAAMKVTRDAFPERD